MSSLLVLAGCAVLPWVTCATFRAWFPVHRAASESTRERALVRYRRTCLLAGVVAIPAAAVAGAIVAPPALSTRFPTAGAWFFGSVSMTTAAVAIALARRTPEEAKAMSPLETAGRAVQMSAMPIVGTGLALLGRFVVLRLELSGGVAEAIIVALLSVAAVTVVSPWLVMKLGVWPLFPKRLAVGPRAWQLAHLPAPTPYLTHAAALPWLRTALVSDGLFNRAPQLHWQTLVRYEAGDSLSSRGERAPRWALAIVLSAVLFMAAGIIGGDEPGKLVAATALAVFFTAVASWFANRRASARLSLDSEGPSMEELAQSLRSLPPVLGQALPRTSHKPLGQALYDRLYALGHDPGRRPHR
ncbi:MAG: hypothetical protein KJN97_13015 [Deltaproteobacteria bacterium]|nr:hypothetical protein [Deltaproteobacteria bacterium]